MQSTNIVYVCSPDWSDQLIVSMYSLFKSGTTFDKVIVYCIGSPPPSWVFADPRVEIRERESRPEAEILRGRKVLRQQGLSLPQRIRPHGVSGRRYHRSQAHRFDLAAEAMRMSSPDSPSRVFEPTWSASLWDDVQKKVGGTAGYPYFNSGCLVFQNGAHRKLEKTWPDLISSLGRGIPVFANALHEKGTRLTEQLALSLAMGVHNLSYSLMSPKRPYLSLVRGGLQELDRPPYLGPAISGIHRQHGAERRHGVQRRTEEGLTCLTPNPLTMSMPPIDARALAQTGADALRRGDARTARALFERIIAAGQADTSVCLGLTYACRRLDDKAGALAAVDRALEREPRNLRVLILKADCMADIGDARGASSFYQFAVKIAPPADQMPVDLRDELQPGAGDVRALRRGVRSVPRGPAGPRGPRRGSVRRPIQALARHSAGSGRRSITSSRASSISRSCPRFSSTTGTPSRGSTRSKPRRRTSAPS